MDWYNIGYTDGMAFCTKAIHSIQYPTRDTNSAENEKDYLAGYHGAIHDYQMAGFNTALAYLVE